MDEEHQDLYKPINGALRNFKIIHSLKKENESINQHRRFLSCNYSLRENPKKKTQKSPESLKRILLRCEEYGKRFRYEKNISNHHQATGEELQVAEWLILLSKSSPKFIEIPKGSYSLGCLRNKKPSESESGFFSSERRVIQERVSSYETWKEPASFLGGKCTPDQQKLRKRAWKEEASLLGEKNELDQRKLLKAGDSETELGVRSMEYCFGPDTEMDKRSGEYQCRLCNKIFSSFQALGGHQTFHRMSKSKNNKNCTEKSLEPVDESVRCSVTKEKKTHKSSHLFKEFQVG